MKELFLAAAKLAQVLTEFMAHFGVLHAQCNRGLQVAKLGAAVIANTLEFIGEHFFFFQQLRDAIGQLNLPARAGAGREIQLTDGIAQLLKKEKVFAYEFEGVRYDCGSKLGYLKATVALGMKHAEVGHEFSQYLGQLGRGKK